ncbi:phage tail assembly protein [Pseudomonas sp. 10B1]|uniref:phage tail assembly protein n=1 Tax=unclassified Pseudomonas TaxID=196821 RepID=UPI002B223D66|nr:MULTISPECIES: phage tail assembly protein [unclassified Pseudomonas]MEA9997050.1 phage tail assembly protein [Pseudomonas sp. AA4]MEB0089240.1 phage tail assembly protein [Pseudomonas sp. RTI1]MEB0128432.1 phage tail assembly protein [Pseudomonas sp. CCC1.2]MEB0155330.1 phage tail assembly protein [Pseudomonas sp. CCC4.3]MEB0221698.1 phage tail assembly protein [Pseudomonas sp. AB12(2023)]
MFEEEITIELSKPVVIGSGDTAQTYTELKLREPTAGEIEKAARMDTGPGSAITIISLITKIPRSAIEKISKRDLVAANKFLEGFSDTGPSVAG